MSRKQEGHTAEEGIYTNVANMEDSCRSLDGAVDAQSRVTCPGRLLQHQSSEASSSAQYSPLQKTPTISPSSPHRRSTPSTPSKMSHLVPNRKFSKDHESAITVVAVSPEGQRMVTGSNDRMLRLWDLRTGIMLKKMEGNRHEVRALAVSRDGQMIASGGDKGEIIIWHGETGEYLIQVMMADSYTIFSLDFSPDGTVLASGSMDWATKFWSTVTWEMEGNPIESSTWVNCVRYSPSGKLLAIATDNNLKIYNSDMKECVADMGNNYTSHGYPGQSNSNHSLAWTPDGTHLLSTSCHCDSLRIQEWDTSIWKQVGDHWIGLCSHHIKDIVIDPTCTLIASASLDQYVRLWRLSDRKPIAIFQHSAPAMCVTFSIDGKHILSGGGDKMISEWAVPEDANSEILIDDTAACNACITEGRCTAKRVIRRDRLGDAGANEFTSHANRSIIMAQTCEWGPSTSRCN